MTQQVEGHPFGGQDACGPVLSPPPPGIPAPDRPRPGYPTEDHARVEETEGRFRHPQTGHPALGFEDQRPHRLSSFPYQGDRGQITSVAQIFGESLLQEVMEVSRTGQLRPTWSIRSTANRARRAMSGSRTTS